MRGRYVLGLTEMIAILGNENTQENVLARIDTGATSSSIDISLAQRLKLGPSTKSKTVKSASAVHKRPIVRARVKINGITIEEEFTLADRSHMTYLLLIGQRVLKKGNFLIDPLKEAYKK